MSEHARPKMKPHPLPTEGFDNGPPAEENPFTDKQPIPVANPVLSAEMVPAGAVLAEWRPRSHGRAGVVAALQMLEALDHQRPHLKDKEHLYDGCTKMLGDD
ncbi:hypothetical protein [Aestuariispira ectoiniformans]|uniref:hypothetical protein n=1 Tax=Aestuariispira ectoiniformans TaxID=2775080 RepID=UPI00223C08B6|nr:hypothetical protein [Aestuariispira ectoiniformans]